MTMTSSAFPIRLPGIFRPRVLPAGVGSAGVGSAGVGSAGIAVAGIAVALLLAGVPQAQAGAATNLKCNGCVGKSDLGKKSVTTDNIKSKAVTTGKLANRAVTQGKIADEAVTSGKLADKAVTTDKIADGAVTPDHLGDSALPAGVEASEEPAVVNLNPDPEPVAAATVSAPATGYILATATWLFSASVEETGYCYLSAEDGGTDGPAITANVEEPAGTNAIVPAALTRVLAVEEGDTTIYLNCNNERLFDGFSVTVSQVSLTALFVPNRY